MRRDSKDAAWAKVKRTIYSRDNDSCRLIKTLSVSDMMALKRNAGQRIGVMQPAHIYPVSLMPEIMYEPENLITLNAYSHSMLDSMRDPITGKNISKSEVYKWWEKIAGKSQWRNLGILIEEKKHER